MKKALFFLFVFFLWSCESAENKNSRLTIDKYSRKLNSITESIVSNREEEGSQTKLTMNNFYSRYTSAIEEYINDLNFETISPRYQQFRDYLLSHAKNLNTYLTFRKNAIIDLSDAMSSYKSAQNALNDYYEDRHEAQTSYYMSDFYWKSARKDLQDAMDEVVEFVKTKYSYLDNIHKMDSIFMVLDSASAEHNLVAGETKLIERFNIPTAFRDTVGDWVIMNKNYIDSLQPPVPK